VKRSMKHTNNDDYRHKKTFLFRQSREERRLITSI
jgi:hypothetical protein